MWQRVVDCLGVSVSIESDVPSIAEQLTAVFRTFADTGAEPQLRYVLAIGEQPTLLRDGKALHFDAALDLVGGLELDLYRRVAERATGLVLHAAAVVGGDQRTLVFTGVSGAGKSTLLRALLARGYSYLTEECVALRDARECTGLARALHVEDDTIEVPAGFTVNDYVMNVVSGGTKRTRLFHPPEASVWRRPARPAAVVLLSHGVDAPDTLVRISTAEALVGLWPMVFRGTPLEAAGALGALPCYRLHTTTPANAQRLAWDLGEELGVIPG